MIERKILYDNNSIKAIDFETYNLNGQQVILCIGQTPVERSTNELKEDIERCLRNGWIH